jgi:nitroreductase
LELTDAIQRRRMVRAFTSDPLPEGTVAALVDLARRAPSAGHSQGWAFLAMEGPAETARYWDVALPVERREGFRWPGLVSAPALVVALVRPEAWVERYGEPDKAGTGLGTSPDAWPVPYWWVDGGTAVEHLLLGAVDRGLGACFFGLFAHEAAVLAALGVPEGWRAVGTVALGHPDPAADRPGRSAPRGRRPLDEVLHRGTW